MYTTLHLMRVKWKFSEDESLEMATVKDWDFAWYNIKSVPWMIQNQLGHLLKMKLINLNRKILKVVQNLMKKREQHMWIVITLAVFLLLHIQELDAGRNILWSRYRDPVCSSFKIYNQTLLTTKAQILNTFVKAKDPHWWSDHLLQFATVTFSLYHRAQTTRHELRWSEVKGYGEQRFKYSKVYEDTSSLHITIE